jgi:hypothetical protein
MNRLLVTFLGLILALGSLKAQPNQREDRIQAFRIAIFTEVLQLTAEEAQGFWPVYNAYTDKREALQRQFNSGKQLLSMSDAEVEDYIKSHFEKKQKDLDLEKELYQNLRGIIPTRKIAQIPEAERNFRESLIKKIQENRERRQNNATRRPMNRGN